MGLGLGFGLIGLNKRGNFIFMFGLDWHHIVESIIIWGSTGFLSTLAFLFRKNIGAFLGWLFRKTLKLVKSGHKQFRFFLRIRRHMAYLRRLISKHSKLMTKSRTLESQLAQLQLQHSQKNNEFTEAQAQLLLALAKHERISLTQLSEKLKWNLNYTKAIASIAEASDFIYNSHSIGDPECTLMNAGRIHLVKLGRLTQN